MRNFIEGKKFDFGSRYVRVSCRESKMQDLSRMYMDLTIFHPEWSVLDRQKTFVKYIRRTMDKELTYSIENKDEEKA